MRRMITTKQQEFVDELGKQIQVGSDAVNVSGTDELHLNSMAEDPYAQIAVTEAPAIALKIYNENEDELESKLTVDETGVHIQTNGQNIADFGRMEDESYSINYAGMPGLSDVRGEFLVEFYVHDEDDEEIVISHRSAAKPNDPAVLTCTAVLASLDEGKLIGRGIEALALGSVPSGLVAQLNTLAPTNLYVRVVGNPWDEYAFMGINVKIGANTFAWDSSEECLVLTDTWQPLSAQFMEPGIYGSLQSDLTGIGWYNS